MLDTRNGSAVVALQPSERQEVCDVSSRGMASTLPGTLLYPGIAAGVGPLTSQLYPPAANSGPMRAVRLRIPVVAAQEVERAGDHLVGRFAFPHRPALHPSLVDAEIASKGSFPALAVDGSPQQLEPGGCWSFLPCPS